MISGVTTTSDIKVGTGATLNVYGGATFSGIVTATSFNLDDNNKLNLGDSSDLQLWHNGSHSNIKNSTGRLYILANDIWIKDGDDGDFHARFLHDDASELYFDGGKKLETTNTGVTVTGTVAATAFTGDGSGLTGTGVGGNSSINTTGIITATAFVSNQPSSHKNYIMNGKAMVFQRYYQDLWLLLITVIIIIVWIGGMEEEKVQREFLHFINMIYNHRDKQHTLH